MDLKSWMIIPQRYNLYKIRNPQCPLFKWSHIKRKLKLISKAVKTKVCVQGRYFKGAGNILHKVTLFRYQPILHLILHSNDPVKKKNPLFFPGQQADATLISTFSTISIDTVSHSSMHCSEVSSSFQQHF